MKVPSSLPLRNAWSPVGYQVVQVGDDHIPANSTRNSNTGADEATNSGGGSRLPASPVGCQVVQVGDERIGASPKSWSLKNRPSIALPQRKASSLLIWGPLLACGAFMALLLFGFLASLSMWVEPQTDHRAAWVNQQDVPVGNMELIEQAPRQVLLPENAADLPVRQVPDEAALEIAQSPVVILPAGPLPLVNLVQLAAANAATPDPAKVGHQADEDGNVQPLGETFGTAVRFARNPSEAAHIAGKERKLTFLLHVSGNFEDSCFT